MFEAGEYSDKTVSLDPLYRTPRRSFFLSFKLTQRKKNYEVKDYLNVCEISSVFSPGIFLLFNTGHSLLFNSDYTLFSPHMMSVSSVSKVRITTQNLTLFMQAFLVQIA